MEKAGLKTIVLRGLKSRCPKCGEGQIFEKWNHLKETCGKCGLVIREREDATWFFMYMSTAGITGLFIVSMFLFTPRNMLIGKIGVACLALVVFFSTTGPRKGVAIAWEYWVDLHSEFPRFPI